GSAWKLETTRGFSTLSVPRSSARAIHAHKPARAIANVDATLPPCLMSFPFVGLGQKAVAAANTQTRAVSWVEGSSSEGPRQTKTHSRRRTRPSPRPHAPSSCQPAEEAQVKLPLRPPTANVGRDDRTELLIQGIGDPLQLRRLVGPGQLSQGG